MHHCVKTAVLLMALSCAQAAFAFLPPADKQEGVTLSIEGFKEKIEKERLSAAEVPADKPLSFTVTLKNERAQTVGGVIQLWLNDDWQMVGKDTVTLTAEPGKSVSATCSATAKRSVLNALYPIHAKLSLSIDGKAIELHPIAIFEAVTAAAEKSVSPQAEVALSDGVLRLDSGADCRVFSCQKGVAVELGVNFSGADRASGTHMSREKTTRNGVARQSFAVHPPYRGTAGVTWNEFKLALPADKPAVLTFFTAIRDQGPAEPASDGTEHKVIVIGADGKEKELFTRFSDSKTWQPAAVNLCDFAGQHITLRLWTGPGPKNNTTCDQCFWGDPLITVGNLPALPTEAEWLSREQKAASNARSALIKRPKKGSGAFRLQSSGQRYGAAIILGRQGLTDGVIAFSDGTRELIYRGFACDVDNSAVGGIENGLPVMKVETATDGDAWLITHDVARMGPCGQTLSMRAKIWADDGALRIAWDMPGVTRDTRGTPRYSRLGIGAASLPVWRVYAGFGNVIENPGAFDLHGGGFVLSTRHIGADYANGLSLVQACDIFPDRLTHEPTLRRFALETHHDAAFFFIPSARGAFAAAREYRNLCGFKKGRGVNTILGRMCLDQWGGDYLIAAKDLAEAAKYGVTDAIFVKHAWQRWGYDYRLPEIYPPAGGLEPFLTMRKAAENAGILFCPHDNYIDFYPDAEGYSYDRIVFYENGTPMKAWYNKYRGALSYRWLPHGFRPWLEPNMRKMHDHFEPDSLFIDEFTAFSPFDYYDRAGTFYPRTRTAKEWKDAFDTCRTMLKKGAPMISEAGTDALIGSLDAGEADHFPAQRWMKEFGDADRTPWHDMATHGKMVLLAGGLGPRYSAFDWDDHSGKPLHGYGSDDYLSNTVMGGRNPMCDGPFSRRSVMTYWLLHDVCAVLAREDFETHSFGATIKQQHTTFTDDGKVWVNRGSNLVWTVAGEKRALPEYGFYVSTPDAEAGIVLINGQRAGFAKSEKTFFADARPVYNQGRRRLVESSAADGKYLGNGAFEVTFNWNVLDPSFDGYQPFMHICSDASSTGNSEKIAFQADMRFDRALLKKAGAFTATARITVPQDMPAGEYKIRYGLFKPANNGDRMPIMGPADGNQRIRGGIMKVAKAGNGFTSGTFTQETDNDDAKTLGLNVAKKMLDFGPLATDGAFRLIHDSRHAWQLIPLPGSNPFKAELRLAAFGAKRATVKAVEKIDAFNAASKDAEWTQDGTTLRLACDGQSFSYRIIFQ